MKKMHLKRLTALALGLSLMASALIPGVPPPMKHQPR